MDVHLAWPAQSCPLEQSRLLLGSAPTAQLQAVADLLASYGASIRHDLFRLVTLTGQVIPTHGIAAHDGGPIGVIDLDREPQGGLASVMLTLALTGPAADRFRDLLRDQPHASRECHSGFVITLGLAPDAASPIFDRLSSPGTIRHSELPRLLLAAAGQPSLS
jgi:hypothetical protein